MREEFHGINNATFKQLYGWNTLNANIWLPSLSELVGTTGTQHAAWGTYLSAMQGLNVSTTYHTMQQGGAQWVYPAQYNATGGGALLWKLCGQGEFWLRTPDYGQNHAVLSYQSETGVRYVSVVTNVQAVHPAVLYKTVFGLWL